MERIVPEENIGLFMAELVKAQRDAEEQLTFPEALAAIFHGYLYVARDCKVAPEKYAAIKQALQEIIDCFIIGMNVETFEDTEVETETEEIAND